MKYLIKYRVLLIILLIAVVPQLNVWGSPDQPPVLDTQDTITIYFPIITNGHYSAPISDGLVIDHNSIALFDQIPQNYITAASQLRMLFRHASVGYNISYSLNCLGNYYNPRLSGCDRGVPSGDVFFNDIYNRDNWIFEFHLPPPAQNPGWWEKVSLFVNRVDNLSPSEDYDILGYKHGYVDAYAGSEIDDLFFSYNPNDPYMGIDDLEALEARHPDKTIILWTMGLAKLSYPDSENFNRQLRNYATTHNKILMDIAAIESHRPDGTRCYSILNNGVEALCDEYTEEDGGGHLNGWGGQRMAKSVWVLMARLAGWTP